MRLPAVLPLVAGCALLGGASGCGGDDPTAQGPAVVETADPERAFAPLVELAEDERYRPMSARWFIENAAFGIEEAGGCPDRVIAVGHQLPERQTRVTDWIYPRGLGKGPHYYRNPYDADCELTFGERFYTDQLSRPHDPGPRLEILEPSVGYELDLEDDARRGPSTLGDTTVYVDRVEEGDGRVRLTYWMLFGMHAPPPGSGEGPPREGDWERVDVLLDREGDGSYVPRAIQLGIDGHIDADELREVPWAAVRRVDGVHPLVTAAPGSHTLTAVRDRRDGCGDCVPWRTWRVLADARKQLWYGFGGAWGEAGDSDATTGPLGPHRRFATAADYGD